MALVERVQEDGEREQKGGGKTEGVEAISTVHHLEGRRSDRYRCRADSNLQRSPHYGQLVVDAEEDCGEEGEQ